MNTVLIKRDFETPYLDTYPSHPKYIQQFIIASAFTISVPSLMASLAFKDGCGPQELKAEPSSFH